MVATAVEAQEVREHAGFALKGDPLAVRPRGGTVVQAEAAHVDVRLVDVGTLAHPRELSHCAARGETKDHPSACTFHTWPRSPRASRFAPFAR